jgi:hypothetical protein
MSIIERTTAYVLIAVSALNVVLAFAFVVLLGAPEEGLLLLPASCLGLWTGVLMLKRTPFWWLAAVATSVLYLGLVSRTSLTILYHDLTGMMPTLWWSSAQHVLLESDAPWDAKAYYLVHHRMLVLFFLALGVYAALTAAADIWRRSASRARGHA